LRRPPSATEWDANAFDPETDYVFSSNGEGTLTVIHEDSPGKFTVVDNISTKKSARTMGFDVKTHNIFLPAADFDAPTAGGTPRQDKTRVIRGSRCQQSIDFEHFVRRRAGQ